MTAEIGTLKELNISHDDVVMYAAGNRNPANPANHYTCVGAVKSDKNTSYILENAVGVRFTFSCNYHKLWKIVSRALPKKWKDMTDAEQGAILLAVYRCETIEAHLGGKWVACIKPITTAFCYSIRYRVAPKTITKDVCIVSEDGMPLGTGHVTVRDGKIDWSTLKGGPNL